MATTAMGRRKEVLVNTGRSEQRADEDEEWQIQSAGPGSDTVAR